MLGVGAKKKVYMDDVFSTFVYEGKGDNTTNSVTNNVDLTEGGMVWTKGRDITYGHIIYDSLRGQNYLTPNENYEQATDSRSNIAFNSTGYTFGDASSTSWGPLNEGNKNFASWTFRKAPGFFDVVTYTGNGTAGRQISHDLNSKPGLILIKRTDAAAKWIVYHRDTGASKSANLNNTNAFETDTYSFNQTEPSSTHFSVGSLYTNVNNEDYVAYVFAGGESTAATARSVDFDGSGDYLLSGSSSDYTFGTGDFTVEGWVKLNDTNNRGIFQISTASTGYASYSNSVGFSYMGSRWDIYGANNTQMPATANNNLQHSLGQWIHFAYSRSSGTSRVFVNGFLLKEFSDTTDYTGSYLAIGSYKASGYELNGSISNFRVVKGTAVYTSSFRPPTEPLTNITNTKLLCCNNSSTTGSTVTPGTITANGDPTASTDSPFDDPAGFVFGEAGSESVIKCGSYVGSGSAGLEVNLGWEPQWVMVKNTTTTAKSWFMNDSMRGIISGDNDPTLYANDSAAEVSTERISLTPTGFKVDTTSSGFNTSGDNYIYICIRRPDGYVGKPPELGTGVFAMDTGNGSSTIPAMDSGFPVDFALWRQHASTEGWSTGARLMGTKYVVTNTTATESSYPNHVWDSNAGILKTDYASNYFAWMWKRNAGMDVVAYTGNSTAGRQIPHNLSKTPEMIWVKSRSNTFHWVVGHKGLDGGTNPWEKNLYLNDSSSETDYTFWNDSAPSVTQFTVGNDDYVNGSSSKTYIAMLFASVDGISKVGSYTGTGSSGNTITLGFQPRFVIIKNASTSSTSWVVLDTTRGWGSGNDKSLELNDNQAQETHNYGAPTSTGFTIDETGSWTNTSGNNYIYYAHA